VAKIALGLLNEGQRSSGKTYQWLLLKLLWRAQLANLQGSTTIKIILHVKTFEAFATQNTQGGLTSQNSAHCSGDFLAHIL
jgi:hypothetical protein